MYKNIYLKKGKEDSLKRFHPWVFSGAIAHMDDGIEEGDIVRVITQSGAFIALGHYQIGSIAVRVLSFQDIAIDDDFWKQRLAAALLMRQCAGIADNPETIRSGLYMVKATTFRGWLLTAMARLQSCRLIVLVCMCAVMS